jgi:hypothetical protein
MSIGEPTADRYGVLGVEDIGCWGVVDDDGFSKISSDLGKVFDVVSLVIVTAFTEETVVNNVMDI